MEIHGREMDSTLLTCSDSLMMYSTSHLPASFSFSHDPQFVIQSDPSGYTICRVSLIRDGDGRGKHLVGGRCFYPTEFNDTTFQPAALGFGPLNASKLAENKFIADWCYDESHSKWIEDNYGIDTCRISQVIDILFTFYSPLQRRLSSLTSSPLMIYCSSEVSGDGNNSLLLPKQRTFLPLSSLRSLSHVAFVNPFMMCFLMLTHCKWTVLLAMKTRLNSLFRQGMRNWALTFGLVFETLLAAGLTYIPFIVRLIHPGIGSVSLFILNRRILPWPPDPSAFPTGFPHFRPRS